MVGWATTFNFIFLCEIFYDLNDLSDAAANRQKTFGGTPHVRNGQVTTSLILHNSMINTAQHKRLTTTQTFQLTPASAFPGTFATRASALPLAAVLTGGGSGWVGAGSTLCTTHIKHGQIDIDGDG